MSIDSKTREALEYHGRRMRFALSEGDTKEAEAIQDRIDAILDTRPGVHAVAPDGEVVYDNASPWVKDQVLAPEAIESFVNEVERNLGDEGGGIGLLDRP